MWRVTTDVIDDTVTVTIHDGGEDVLDDGRRLYAAETLELTASDADPAHATLTADVAFRWRAVLPAAVARGDPSSAGVSGV